MARKGRKEDKVKSDASIDLHDQRIEVKNPVSIQLMPEKAKILTENEKKLLNLRRTITITIFGFLIIISGLYLYSFKYRTTASAQTIFPNISFTYVYPRYLLKGDQNTLDITVTNLSSAQSFNGIITLILADANIPVSPLPNKNLSIVIKDLHPNDRVTKQITFTIPENSPVREINYYFQVFKIDGTPYMSVNNTFYRSTDVKLKVFAIPFVTTIVLAIIGSVSILTTIVTSWDQVKKLAGLAPS